MRARAVRGWGGDWWLNGAHIKYSRGNVSLSPCRSSITFSGVPLITTSRLVGLHRIFGVCATVTHAGHSRAP